MSKIMHGVILTFVVIMAGFVNASDDIAHPEKILIVLTSHSDLGNTGQKTGFWLPELTHPYYEFTHAGFQVELASPLGGMAPLDGKSFHQPDDHHQRFLQDAKLMAKVMRTLPLSTIDPTDYRAVLFSGGSGPMWDFPNNPNINRVASSIYNQGGVVSAVCHGTAALVGITQDNGEPLIHGKRVAAFTRQEESDIDQLDIIPFLLGEKLTEMGAIHIAGPAWQEKVVIDGRLMTGQNPASAKKLAQKIIHYLENYDDNKLTAKNG